eukprot:3903183-Karenia_brevis.AAC.1
MAVVPDAHGMKMVHYSLSGKVCDIEVGAIMKPVSLADLKRSLPRPYDLRDWLALQLKARQYAMSA